MDKELVAHIVEHVKLANGGDGDDGAEFEIESPAVMLRLELWGHEYLMQLGREVCGMTKIRSHGGQRRRFMPPCMRRVWRASHRSTNSSPNEYPSTGAAIVPFMTCAPFCASGFRDNGRKVHEHRPQAPRGSEELRRGVVGEVPTHWSVRRLRNLVTRMRASNLEKLARSGHGVGQPIESARR